MTETVANSVFSESHSLPRCDAEAQGLASAAVQGFVEALDSEIVGLHSVMLLRHGHVIAEGWWSPYAPALPHLLFSLSKSFTSTAAGLAVDEGRLRLADRVVGFFPDDVPAKVSENLAQMTVRDLLTMTTGHAEDTLRFLAERRESNWARAFLRQPVAFRPGMKFLYNSGATYMVSAILQQVTGQTLLDYLGPRLFAPLGISGGHWVSCPLGVNTGGWGLSLKTEDIAKFGQLYLADGVWKGRRLLPESWVAEATAAQVPNGDDPNSDWAQGYGYQFWRCRHGAYRGDGAFGQYCVVLPEQDAVIAITSGTNDMGGVLNLVWKQLLPAFGRAPLDADPAASEALRQRLASLKVPVPNSTASLTVGAAEGGRTYQIAENEYNVRTFRADFGAGRAEVTIGDANGEHRIACGLSGAWVEGETALDTPGYPVESGRMRRVLATGVFRDERTFIAKLCFVETPFSPTITCHFDGDRVLLDFRADAAFGPTEWPQFVGVGSGPAL
jgi:CubicO group peptidase (beta-lactamase class C family)